MAKYLTTKDDSIGAKQTKEGKYLVARYIDGRKVLELLEDPQQIADIIDKVVPIAQHIIQVLKDFIQSIFQRFPSVVIYQGNNYVYTLQPAAGKGKDRVFYMNADDGNERIFEFEHKHMGKAKSELFKAMKSAGFV